MKKSGKDRGVALAKLADLIEKNSAELTALEVLNVGS